MVDLESLLFALGVALPLAKILGYAMERIKQPAVIGEIIAGIILGPFAIGRFIKEVNFVSPAICEETEAIAKIGIILLLLLSGIETGIGEIRRAGKSGIITSMFDVSIAFIFGYIVGSILGYDVLRCIAIGNIFTATSVGVTVKTLMDMNALHTDVGELILTVAVLDDILGIIVLSITLGRSSPEILLIKVVIFFLIFALILFSIRKFHGIGSKLHLSRFIFSLSIAFCFIFSALALSLGLAAITGSFFAGLVLSTLPQRKAINDFVRRIGELFFIPLFFVWVGASFDFSALKGVGTLILYFLPFALAGKIIGCSLGAKVNRFRTRDAIAVGIGMMPRMEVALIVATTEISMGIWSKTLAHQILAATIMLVIVSSFITPFLLKAVYKPEEKNEERRH